MPFGLFGLLPFRLAARQGRAPGLSRRLVPARVHVGPLGQDLTVEDADRLVELTLCSRAAAGRALPLFVAVVRAARLASTAGGASVPGILVARLPSVVAGEPGGGQASRLARGSDGSPLDG